MKALQGTRVLVTRPRHQNPSQIQMLREAGAQVIALPLIRIEPCEGTAALKELTGAQSGWDIWIVTSANAARQLSQIRQEHWPQEVFTLGQATAAALESGLARRANPRCMEEGLTSESLLADQRLTQVKGSRILLCAGQGGRGLIEQTLRARGAQVQRLNLYRRVPEQHDPEDLNRRFGQANACIVTSGEGLRLLHALCPPPVQNDLLGWPLVVPSVRVIEIARGLGHTLVEAPKKMSDAALVDCLTKLWHGNSGETVANPSR